MFEIEEETSPPRFWHRGVYLLAAFPLLFFTLVGWEHGAYITFGIPAIICVGLALWPARFGAMILFWLFAAGACLYGWLLIQDLLAMSQGRRPSVLLGGNDSFVFVMLELTLIAVSVLLFIMWKPFAKWWPRA